MTRDTHFPTLLRITPKCLGSDVFLPYNREFWQALVFNPFKLYLLFNNIFKPEFDHKHSIVFPENFEPTGVSREQIKSMRQRILEYWERFSIN